MFNFCNFIFYVTKIGAQNIQISQQGGLRKTINVNHIHSADVRQIVVKLKKKNV